MNVFSDYSDARTHGLCIYCGGSPETREHIPPKAFLDKPYPCDLPVVEACTKCNIGFSLDEEYMACLIDCVISGSADPTLVLRESTRKSMIHTPALAERLTMARTETDSGILFTVERDRVVNVVKKMAIGHIFYELGLLVPMENAEVSIAPFPSFDHQSISRFENIGVGETAFFPEVGSRALQRLFEFDENYENGWIHVQRGRYRYSVAQADTIEVRMVFSEYLACIARWEQ